jgi:PAS domain-containing protein
MEVSSALARRFDIPEAALARVLRLGAVLVLSGSLVWADYATGPYVYFSALFVLPVAVLAWFHGRWAVLLALALAAGRAAIALLAWHQMLGPSTVVANALINAFTLVLAAVLVAKLARQARLLSRRWDRTVECLPLGVITTDGAGRVVYANSVARRLLSELPSIAVTSWKESSAAFVDEVLLARALRQGVSTLNKELEVPLSERDVRTLLTSTSPVTDERGAVTGAVIVYEDITSRKAMQVERERLNASLTHALAEVKALKGLLPMCASCGKVRNTQGHWECIEHYLVTQCDVEVSHGICNDCAYKLYPSLARRLPHGGRS